jgi:hypothetical protein
VPNDAAAYLRCNDAPAATDVSGSVVLGGLHAANGGSTKEHVPASATVTLALTDSALAGYTPGCVTVTLTNHGVLDEIDAVPFLTPDQPAPVMPPLPPPAPPLPASPTIAFASTKFKVSRSGVVSVRLKPFDRDVKGRVTVADRADRRLGAKAYSAKLGKAVTVKVRLNAATRRRLAQGRRVKVRLSATAPGATTLRTNVTIRR